MVTNMSVISTFSPVSSLSSNGLRMCVCVCLWIVRNELIHGYASVVYTLSSFRPHTHTKCTHTSTHTHTITHTHYDTHILISSEDCKPTGAKSGHCQHVYPDIANMSIQSIASSSIPTRLNIYFILFFCCILIAVRE